MSATRLRLRDCPPGEYFALGNQVVLEEDGRLHIPDSGYLAGSSATILECMNHLASLDILPLEDLIMPAFDNPLELIGVEPAVIDPLRPIEYDEKNNLFR